MGCTCTKKQKPPHRHGQRLFDSPRKVTNYPAGVVIHDADEAASTPSKSDPNLSSTQLGPPGLRPPTRPPSPPPPPPPPPPAPAEWANPASSAQQTGPWAASPPPGAGASGTGPRSPNCILRPPCFFCYSAQPRGPPWWGGGRGAGRQKGYGLRQPRRPEPLTQNFPPLPPPPPPVFPRTSFLPSGSAARRQRPCYPTVRPPPPGRPSGRPPPPWLGPGLASRGPRPGAAPLPPPPANRPSGDPEGRTESVLGCTDTCTSDLTDCHSCQTPAAGSGDPTL